MRYQKRLSPIALSILCLLASRGLRAGADSCPGLWQSLTVVGAFGGISDVVSLPDGTLVVGLKTAGLGFYDAGTPGGYGYSWRIVTKPSQGTGGLRSNKVTALAVFQGELWVGTQDAGISILNLATKNWRTIDTTNSTLPSNYINHINPVPADPTIINPKPADESLLVSTPLGLGIYRYLNAFPFFGWFWRVLDQAHGLPESYVTDAAVQFGNGQRYTWIATSSGLLRWDGTNFEDYRGSCDFDTAERILVDASNRAWFSGIKRVPGIGQAGDGGGGTVVQLPVGLCRATVGRSGLPVWTSFPEQYGHDMSVDSAGRVWFSGIDQAGVDSGGGWVHDQGTWCVFRSPEKPILSNQVSSVHAMGELTWFAQNGSAGLDRYSNNWSALTSGDLFNSGFGPVAFGLGMTFVGGISGISYQGGPPKDYWHFLKLSTDPLAVATAILPVDDGVWVGVDADGLHFVQINPNTFEVQGTTAYHPADGLAGNGVQAIARDKGKRLWVGTSQGLSLKGNGYWLSFTSANSPLIDNDVSALTVDALGKLWVGTMTSGISILDPEALGGNAWSTQTTADGLAANEIRALTTGPGGVIWAATDAGVCERDPVTGVWTVHDASSGELPGAQARSVAIDSAGRVWVGTTAGLAVREAGAWRHYHVTSSSLDDDSIQQVAARGTELWATTLGQVAVRKDIAGPIGEFPPEIASFQPTGPAPGDFVTVTGKHFDDRGPSYNQVFVGGAEGSNGGSAQPSQVWSVTPTEIVFKVRELAQDGKIRVVSHCLEQSSAAILKIAPMIWGVSPTCASLGDSIIIHGAGFTVGGGAEVRFGNGPWRHSVLLPGGSLREDMIVLPLTLGDQEGKVQVRNSNGLVATSVDELSIGHVELESRTAYQGVEGVPLIWGKRTLVSVQLKAAGCSTMVSGGKFYWKKKDNTLQLGGRAYARVWDQNVALDIAGTFDPRDPSFAALEFVGEFESARSSYKSIFPLSDLASVVCVVQNNNVDVVTVEIPASELNFREIKKPLSLYVIGVFPKTGGQTWQEFWDNATSSLYDVARILPQPDIAPFHGSGAWIGTMASYFEVESADLRSSLLWSDFVHIRGTADDLIDPDFGQFGMALIDETLFVDHKDPDDPDFGGKAPVGPYYNGDTAVSFNFKGGAAPIITQELCHMLGLVDGGAENHDDENDHHSLYDEGEDVDAASCALADTLTYGQSVKDQLGNSFPKLYRITSGAPERLNSDSCSGARAKSCMSYAPFQHNGNALLEPLDTKAVRAFLNELNDRWSDGDGGGAQALASGTTLHLRGTLSMDGTVVVTVSYLDDSEQQPATSPDAGSHYHVILRDVNGVQLLDFPFHVDFHGHGDVEAATAFGARMPFPEGTKTVELLHEDGVLWSTSRSANPPSVGFSAPVGGAYSADSTVQVSWTASDPDGDMLQFALDYSPDGGTTWIKLPQYLTGDSYAWKPGFLPESGSARLRIRASDGFNTATALSALFKLTPAAPLVFIHSPQDGAQIPEGSLVDLVAQSMTSEGFAMGKFLWLIDGQALEGTGNGNEYRFSMAGAHTVEVHLTDPNGLPASTQITVQVIPDFDHDGMPNDWEQSHGLNPLDLTDASKDSDSDGLGNYAEYVWKTDPQNADTDGDGASDGAEVLAGTNPLSPDSVPPKVPTLQLGIFEIGFTVHEGDQASDPRSFWILNHGPGSLNWSITNNLPWLEVSPENGTAPSEVTLTAVPNGLGVGTYSGSIVISAQGAQGSPHTVTVKLTVKPAESQGGPRFIRGDSNSDGKMNISDASFTLTYLFIDATKTPACTQAADSNDDGKVNITDAIYSLGSLFLGGPAPPAPFPACGADPTPDALDCVVSLVCP